MHLPRRLRRCRPACGADIGVLLVLLLAPLPGAGATVLLAQGVSPCSADAAPAMVDGLRNRLEAARTVGSLRAAEVSVRARSALPDFYARRGWTPAWLADGRPTSCARQLLGHLARAHEDGLRPSDYHLELLDTLVERVARGEADAADRLDLELLLTDAFLVHGSHLLRGRVNPVTLEPEWLANRRDLDMAAGPTKPTPASPRCGVASGPGAT